MRHNRSPLLIAAYCMMGVALILLVLRAGMFWTLTSAGLAVLLAVAEVYTQVRRR
jgi:hypothetical protein